MTFHLFTESKTIQDAWLTIDISGPFDAWLNIDISSPFDVWLAIDISGPFDAWLTIDISGPFDADSAETFLVWEVIFRPAVNGVVARVVFI